MNVDVKSAVIIIYIYLVLLFIYTTFGYIVIFFYFVRTLSDQGREKLSEEEKSIRRDWFNFFVMSSTYCMPKICFGSARAVLEIC